VQLPSNQVILHCKMHPQHAQPPPQAHDTVQTDDVNTSQPTTPGAPTLPTWPGLGSSLAAARSAAQQQAAVLVNELEGYMRATSSAVRTPGGMIDGSHGNEGGGGSSGGSPATPWMQAGGGVRGREGGKVVMDEKEQGGARGGWRWCKQQLPTLEEQPAVPLWRPQVCSHSLADDDSDWVCRKWLSVPLQRITNHQQPTFSTCP